MRLLIIYIGLRLVLGQIDASDGAESTSQAPTNVPAIARLPTWAPTAAPPTNCERVDLAVTVDADDSTLETTWKVTRVAPEGSAQSDVTIAGALIYLPVVITS